MPDKQQLKESIFCNTLIFVGIAMLGSGIFLEFGLGPAIGVSGFILLALGTWGASR